MSLSCFIIPTTAFRLFSKQIYLLMLHQLKIRVEAPSWKITKLQLLVLLYRDLFLKHAKSSFLMVCTAGPHAQRACRQLHPKLARG
jgi:hypothetical protein